MKTSALVILAAICTGVASGAYAQGNQLCAADAQKFCSERQGGDRRNCLFDSMDKVTAVCKASLEDSLRRNQQAEDAARNQNVQNSDTQGGGYWSQPYEP